MKHSIVGALTRGLPVGLFFAAILSYDQGWRDAVPAGLAAGVAFGLACELLDLVVDWMQRPERPSFDGEAVLRSAMAHSVIGNDSRRGRLYLTNKHLCFRSLSDGTPRHEWSVRLADVQRSDPTRTFKLIANRLEIVTDGRTQCLLLRDNEGWSAAISTARLSATPASS